MYESFCLLLESQIASEELGNHARVANCLRNGSHLLLQCLGGNGGERCEAREAILVKAFENLFGGHERAWWFKERKKQTKV